MNLEQSLEVFICTTLRLVCESSQILFIADFNAS